MKERKTVSWEVYYGPLELKDRSVFIFSDEDRAERFFKEQQAKDNNVDVFKVTRIEKVKKVKLT